MPTTNLNITTPDASPTVKGKAKLYSDVTGNNTDGAPDQNSVKLADAAVLAAAASDATTKANTAETNAKAYSDGLVVGLLDDRGNFSASGNVFPSTGGSGSAGAILKGDLWSISIAGTLGGQAVTAGDVVRALTDSPGQTSGNWNITENNFGYVAENSANKSTDVNADQASTTKYATVKAVYDWATGLFATIASVALKVTANSVITGATKTKITYDSKGLVTNGSDATTADIADSTNKRYVTDSQLAAIGGNLTGDVTSVGSVTTIANNAVTYTKSYNGTQLAIVNTFRNLYNY